MKKKALQFERIISIGYFCSVAMELEKFSRRDRSYPFDWVISDIHSINDLMANDFKDLFFEELLYRNSEIPNIILHKKYTFDFFHDFERELSIGSQIQAVESRYRRRINHFYVSINKPTLFIRYMMDDELPFWTKKENELMTQLKKFNKENAVLLIVNRGIPVDLKKLTEGVVALFEVDRDENDSVARNFMQDNKQLRDFILNIRYPLILKIKNFYMFYLNKLKNKITNMLARVQHSFRK